jgi:hypothetical protein
MESRVIRLLALVGIIVLAARHAGAFTVPEVDQVARCQKAIAAGGAKFAQKTIRATLKCTSAVIECQVQCDYGVFGPSCTTDPPPCCDSDDPGSNVAFGECMADADDECISQNAKIAIYETQKQAKIINGCSQLTTEQLCGANGEGLSFALLNAGCLALDPNYTCSLQGLMDCIGGPLQRQLNEQIAALLDPRSADAAGSLPSVKALFSGLPVSRKAREDLPAGKVDVWSITGQAGDDIVVRVKTRDDNGNDTSNLEPQLVLLSGDLSTPVGDTSVKQVPCSVPNTCGRPCPQFKRTLPFNGMFGLVVRAAGGNGCTGGGYRLVVVSPNGSVPQLVADDVDPTP